MLLRVHSRVLHNFSLTADTEARPELSLCISGPWQFIKCSLRCIASVAGVPVDLHLLPAVCCSPAKWDHNWGWVHSSPPLPLLTTLDTGLAISYPPTSANSPSELHIATSASDKVWQRELQPALSHGWIFLILNFPPNYQNFLIFPLSPSRKRRIFTQCPSCRPRPRSPQTHLHGYAALQLHRAKS